MLTENELADLCRQRNLSQEAIAVIHNIRLSPPSRPVRSGTHNVATHYASRKMGCVIKAEASSTELAAIYDWDHDKATYEFYDQPPQIKKTHVRKDGRTISFLYTPDFFRIADDFLGWVECKSEEWLLGQEASPDAQYTRDEHGVWRCPSAEHYAHSLGLDFAVRSTDESDPIIIQNIVDLSDYFREDCPRATQEDLQLAHQLMSDGWCWLRDLLDNDRCLGADAVFKLIADEQLYVDLHIVCMMSEPHRTRVFRTKALMDSSYLWLPSLLADSDLGIRKLNPIPGTALLWDGKACEILNFGDTSIFLRMGVDGTLQELPTDDFERLVRNGSITGTNRVADPRAALASERLRHATTSDLASAMHRYKSIHPEFFPLEERTAVKPRSNRKWRRIAQRGLAEYGNEFVGLLPAVSRRGNRLRRLDAGVLEIMHAVIDQEVKSDKAPGTMVSWSAVDARCRAMGLMTPSKKTFQAEIKRVTTPEELKKAREGEKAGYDLELPYTSIDRETPRHGTRPFAIAHIDHTQLDLQFVSEANGMEMGKAYLTVMLDAYTRQILAWIVTFDPPSYRSCMLLIRDCVRRHGRVPQTLVVDQGSEFNSKYFEQLLALLGSHKRMRPASHPRFGSVIERFFGLTNEAFIHALRGNNKALQAPRRLSPTHDPRNLAVWNLRVFREGFEGFLIEVYHKAEHSALGVSPNVAMELGLHQSGARTHTLITYDRNFLIATMPTTVKGTAKIQRDGSFKAEYIDHFSPSLVDYVGQDLPVRYDPFNISIAYVMGKDGWIESRSMYLGQLTGRTEKEIETISQEINAIKKRDGIRQKDMARLLGDYFVRVREIEGHLELERQKARDQELRHAYQGKGLITAQAGGEPTLLESPISKTEPAASKSSFELAFAAISQ